MVGLLAGNGVKRMNGVPRASGLAQVRAGCEWMMYLLYLLYLLYLRYGDVSMLIQVVRHVRAFFTYVLARLFRSDAQTR
jgi:hypothetical protein